ncbi:DUF6894 family protein (plasmid) [Methylobacterium oryzae CBMB20]|jgi:hypothetical protein
MPQYFFHIDGARHYLDTDGVELADLAAARMEALRIIRELMMDSMTDDLWSGGEWVMTVADEAARNLFSIRLSTLQQNDAGTD